MSSLIPARAAPTPDRLSGPSGSTPTRRASALSSGAEARRVRREQLRDFYGLKRDDPAVAPGSAGKDHRGGSGSAEADALDIASPSFVPSEYYDNLISKSSLSELLGAASRLSSDIGKLHSSRHSLVYNHHHQLFSAGDTISQLNARTPQLLSIVTSLQEKFSDISQLADSVALPSTTTTTSPQQQRQDAVDATQGGTLAAAAAAAAAHNGLERVRLMVLAEEPVEKVRETWARIEESLKGVQGVDGVEEVLREGHDLAGANGVTGIADKVVDDPVDNA